MKHLVYPDRETGRNKTDSLFANFSVDVVKLRVFVRINIFPTPFIRMVFKVHFVYNFHSDQECSYHGILSSVDEPFQMTSI